MAAVEFRFSNGRAPREVWVFVDGRRPELLLEGERWICPQSLGNRSVCFSTRDDGYWEITHAPDVLEGPGKITVVFESLPRTGPNGWWHGLIGAKFFRETAPQMRAREMAIGIVDEGLETQAESSCIYLVENTGGEAWGGGRDDHRALHPYTDHGHKVCSLIASQAQTSFGYSGIAAGAEVFFAAAYSDESTDANPRLDIDRVGACIEFLAKKGCHVISISAGDLEERSDRIDQAVQIAADRGAVCFFAAGNSGKTLFPARQRDCHAVAAIGKGDFAPDPTRIYWEAHKHAIPLSIPPYFCWNYSARGRKVDFCAPGVGVISNRDGRAARAIVGTSFACPIAAGTAALILQNNQQYMDMEPNRTRYKHALEVLRKGAFKLGDHDIGFWKHGLLIL